MPLEARVLFQPRLNIGRLLGGVQRENSPPDCFLIRFTVKDQIGTAPRWHGLVDIAQEFQELPGPVARQALAGHLAGFDVGYCEQRGRAVALAVVGHGSGRALRQRHSGPGPVKRLDQRLVIHARHDRPIRRVEARPGDLGNLSVEAVSAFFGEARVADGTDLFSQGFAGSGGGFADQGFQSGECHPDRVQVWREGPEGLILWRGIGGDWPATSLVTN